MQQPPHYNQPPNPFDPPTIPNMPAVPVPHGPRTYVDPPTEKFYPVDRGDARPDEFWPKHNPDGTPFVNPPTRLHGVGPRDPGDPDFDPRMPYDTDQRLPGTKDDMDKARGAGDYDVVKKNKAIDKKMPHQWYLHPGVKIPATIGAIVGGVLLVDSWLPKGTEPASAPHLDLPPTQEQLEPSGEVVPNSTFANIDFKADGDPHTIVYCTDTYVDDSNGSRWRNTIVTPGPDPNNKADKYYHKADFRPLGDRISVSMTQDTLKADASTVPNGNGHWEYEDGTTGQYPANCYKVEAVAKTYRFSADNKPGEGQLRIVPVDPIDQPPADTIITDGGTPVDHALNIQLPDAA